MGPPQKRPYEKLLLSNLLFLSGKLYSLYKKWKLSILIIGTEIRVNIRQLAIMIALLYTWIKGIYSPTFCNCYHLMLWREKQGQQRFPPCMRKGAPHILPREDKSRLSTTPTLLYLPWRQTFSSHWVHV